MRASRAPASSHPAKGARWRGVATAPALCALTFFAFALAVPCWSQQKISVDVNLVTVSFIARDSNGALLGDLKQDDLELFEDSASQKIAFFAKSTDVPLTLGLIVDASGSQEHFRKRHEKDLEVFLRSVLGPRDKAFLLCFGNHLRLVNDFTQSGADMLQHLKIYEKQSDAFPEIGPKEDRDLGTAFYDSIFYSVSEKLDKQDGRRALLVFSDGEDNSSSHDMMTTIEAAQAENVQVYTLRYTETKRNGDLTARNHYGISVMDRIARETGGAHIDARSTDPRTYFQQIAEELRTSYEVGYYPANPRRDDSFRKIVIRPKREGLIIRAKTGYFAR
jgi:VWFA-related protein